ncbi:glycoside hydrolase family 3 [Tengunoibacter tsumagoiensis]|uniref:beta-N-acetylhexosaminidase n=2 Tax=Tengunoibacter tsumagoiensis TaxID=2014871 RepID=A0A401ZU49_9CHLR|nr:glycoside hydrolase family 3 [Tengunoibacter tsumagoiensis]
MLLNACSIIPQQDNTTLRLSPTVEPTTPQSATATPTSLSPVDLATRLVKEMTLDEKLGQMTIVEFTGETATPDLTKMIQSYAIGGVLIENKNGNAKTHDQLLALNQSIQTLSQIPLFITTDYEGGVVNELRQITGERPSNATIGASKDPQMAYQAGNGAAKDLTGLGLNVNFMPIVDVLTNPNNPGLPQRAFSSDATIVTTMGRAYLKGLSEGGIVGCLKHFPGLGSATIDPHKSLPSMDRSLEQLNSIDLVPYKTMIDAGIVPMVMVTHILNPALDPKLPTSLSTNVVTNLLRNTLKFQGVIICDTLWMGGISNTYPLPQAAVIAVQAGTDLLLGPRGLNETQNMLAGLKQAVTSGQLSVSQIDASIIRLLTLKLQYKILDQNKAWQMVKESRISEQKLS